MPADEIAEVLQGSDGNQRDLLPDSGDRLRQEFDRRRGDRPVGLKILRPGELIVDTIRRHGRGVPADGHRDVGAPQPVQQLAREPGTRGVSASVTVTPSSSNDRALHRISERPGIVDVGADVGVEHDLHPLLGPGGLEKRRSSVNAQPPTPNSQNDRFEFPGGRRCNRLSAGFRKLPHRAVAALFGSWELEVGS